MKVCCFVDWLRLRRTVVYSVFVWSLLGSSDAYYDTYDVYVVHYDNGTYKPVSKCTGMPADFGGDLGPNQEMVGCGEATKPPPACQAILPPDNAFNLTYSGCNAYFAVIPRRNCTFMHKTFRAQEAGYSAAIIYNYAGEAPVRMTGRDHLDIEIPSLMVSYSCAQEIIERYPASEGYVVVLKLSGANSIIFVKYLIPFLCVVIFCFLLMIGAMVYKLVRDRRRQQRRRLSRTNLRKIPTKKFKKGEEPETCPICLDDFEEGEKLRVLPCKHAYHCKCVDPWLTKNRKVCPVCKRKVVPSTGDSSDSDSEAPPAQSASTPAPGTPGPVQEDDALVTGHAQQVGNSTFFPQYQSSGPVEGENLSPTTPTERPGPSTRRSRFVVPGFLKLGRRGRSGNVGGGSQEQLVIPVPPAQTEEGLQGV
jgi:E3 ubiquitin-protein ligase RNF13